MFQPLDDLLKSFDKAIEKKENGKFGKEDVKEIYAAAHKLFDGSVELHQDQLQKVCEKWVLLADGRLNKSNAMKKLQGTSRAEAIQSVLLSTL